MVALAVNMDRRWAIVSLKIIWQSLDARAEGVRFQCDRNGTAVPCGIAGLALRDLIDFHRIKSTEENAFRVLLPEIERLVNAKSDAGRFEENKGLVIRPVDLLRYGFQSRTEEAA